MEKEGKSLTNLRVSNQPESLSPEPQLTFCLSCDFEQSESWILLVFYVTTRCDTVIMLAMTLGLLVSKVVVFLAHLCSSLPLQLYSSFLQLKHPELADSGWDSAGLRL